jgi:hypothetical protein
MPDLAVRSRASLASYENLDGATRFRVSIHAAAAPLS